jgi:hypothetical protein
VNFLPWSIDTEFVDAAKKLIANVDVVSFDIFDTAVTRLVDSPCDVWAEVESRLIRDHGDQARGWAKAREKAETLARIKMGKLGHEDVTLDQIYDELVGHDYSLIKGRICEIDAERHLLVAVPEIQQLTYILNELGKPWFFTSDMYLPETVLKSLLIDKGYKGWTRIYVSGDLGMTKHRGTIWPKVKKENIGRVLHIGDDDWSDGFFPKLQGIETLAFQRARSERRTGATLDPNLLPFSLVHREKELELRGSIPDTQKQWRSLGYSLGGPLITRFTNWVAERAKAHDVRKIFFLARDGALMHRAFQVGLPTDYRGYSGTFDWTYLSVSRRPLNLASGYIESTPSNFSPHLIQFVCGMDKWSTANRLIDRVKIEDPDFIEDLKKELGDLDTPILGIKDGRQKYERTVRKHSPAIYEALRPTYSRVLGYLKQEGLLDGRRVAIVDSGWNGSMQRMLNVIRNHVNPDFPKVTGFYYGLWPNSQVNRHTAGVMESMIASPFEEPRDNPGLALGVGIIEELHGADSGSTTDYELIHTVWKPVYQEMDEEEQKQYQEKIMWFQHGAIEYVLKANKDRSLHWTIEQVKSMLNQVLTSPTNSELELLGSLHHSMMFEHSEYPRILQDQPETEAEAENLISVSDWKLGLILHWYRNKDGDKEMVRRLAQKHVGPYLTSRQLRQFGL